MIRVLIADDEKRIRDGLAATLPWAELGLELLSPPRLTPGDAG